MKLHTALLAAMALMVAQSGIAQLGVMPPSSPAYYNALFWVIDGDTTDASLYGKTAVLVRGDSATAPTVSYVNGGWSLEGGLVQAIAQLGSIGDTVTSDFTINNQYSIRDFNLGDHYLEIDVRSENWSAAGTSGTSKNRGIQDLIGIDKWASEFADTTGKIGGRGVSPDNTYAYNYYMFVFDTPALIGDEATFENIGASYQDYVVCYEYYYGGVPDVPSVQEGVNLDEYWVWDEKEKVDKGPYYKWEDALVLRFELIPEPTSAALLALGAACLGLRRRFRR